MIKIEITQEELNILREFNNRYYSDVFERKFDPEEADKGDTRLSGTLGEWAIWKYDGRTLDDYTNYKFQNRLNKTDIILKNKRWDIKTKKTIKPAPWFNSSVEKKQHADAPGKIDGYIFCNVEHNLDIVYCVGFLEIEEFDKIKVSRNPGLDVEDSKGTAKVYKRPTACWDVRIEQEKDPVCLFEKPPTPITITTVKDKCVFCKRVGHCMLEAGRDSSQSCSYFLRGKQYSWL
jgi:hypothetical protein